MVVIDFRTYLRCGVTQTPAYIYCTRVQKFMYMYSKYVYKYVHAYTYTHHSRYMYICTHICLSSYRLPCHLRMHIHAYKRMHMYTYIICHIYLHIEILHDREYACKLATTVCTYTYMRMCITHLRYWDMYIHLSECIHIHMIASL